MKVSVAMAAFNGEKFIEEQLASILSQTRPVDEVIICDDRSSDRTAELAEDFIARKHLQDTWRVEVNTQNVGYASNFIGAVRKTSGDVVFFCDQDDIWLPERVAEMVHILEKNQEIQLLCSEFEIFLDSPDALSPQKWELKQFKNDKSLEKVSFTPKSVFIGCQGCTMCMRRTFLQIIEPYWHKGWAHDEYVWKLALCMDGLYIYHASTLKRRIHDANVSLGKMREITKRLQFLNEYLVGSQAALRFAENMGLEKKKIRKQKKNIYASRLRIELLQNRKYWNIIPLTLRYSACYHKRRAIPVELYMALKG